MGKISLTRTENVLWEHYNNHTECESKGSLNAQTLISIYIYIF